MIIYIISVDKNNYSVKNMLFSWNMVKIPLDIDKSWVKLFCFLVCFQGVLSRGTILYKLNGIIFILNLSKIFKLLKIKQSGFRHDHGCNTALLKVTEDIFEATDHTDRP